MTDETYIGQVRCKNCGSHEAFEISKGTTIKAYAESKEIICKNCGNLMMGKKEEEE